MNRFNLGLHSALFSADRSELLGRIEPLDSIKIEEAIRPTKQELKPLKDTLNQLDNRVQNAMSEFDSEYFNFSNKVGLEIQQVRADRHTLSREQLNRVRDRHRE
jgi:hypothetical protein